jgi:hypothetical protein
MEIKNTTSLKINDIWCSYIHCKYAFLFSLKVTSDYFANKNEWLDFKIKLRQVIFRPNLIIV